MYVETTKMTLSAHTNMKGRGPSNSGFSLNQPQVNIHLFRNLKQVRELVWLAACLLSFKLIGYVLPDLWNRELGKMPKQSLFLAILWVLASH